MFLQVHVLSIFPFWSVFVLHTSDIHFPSLIDVKNSPVLVYPELLVCLNCGKTEFTVPKAELDLLTLPTACFADDAGLRKCHAC
jgi:hypothetical protein